MGSVNIGNQTQIFQYRQSLSSEGFNKLRYKVTSPGIYDGCQVTKVNDSQITVATGTFVIEDSTSLVSVKCATASSISLSVSSINYMIVFRLVWINSENNYIDCWAVEPGDVLPTDVVIAKLSYSGSTLSSVDYSFRTFGNKSEENIFIEAVSNVLYINPSTNFWYINNYTISYVKETIKSNYLTMSSSGTYWLVYTGSAYSTEADTVVMSYNYKKNGFYDTNGYKVLARINYDTGSGEIGIIEIFENIIPTLDNLKKYLDSAKKQAMSYTSGKLTSITYYNHLTTETLATTMAIESFTYSSGVLVTSTLAIYYPTGTLWKTYTYTYTYSSGQLTSVTYTIS